MTYEYLEQGNSFGECAIRHMQSASKFKIVSTWEDEKKNNFSN